MRMSGASPPPAAFSATSRTGPEPVYRDHNTHGSFSVDDDGAVDGVADFTPVFGMVGYSTVPGGGGGRRRRRRLALDPAAMGRLHKFTTVGLAVALVAVLVSHGDMFAPDTTAAVGGAGGKSSCAVVSPDEWAPLPPFSDEITTLAFGSCADQLLPQPHWDTVALQNPEVLVLMGDNVYGDCEDDTCKGLRKAYDDLADHPSFIGARRRLPMVATLDDHDYGLGSNGSFDKAHDTPSAHRDGDGTASSKHDLPSKGEHGNGAHAGVLHKDVAKSIFLDFFGVHPDDERRRRPDDGVYTSYEWGPPGRRLQLILLDARYSRSEFRTTGNASAPHAPHDEDDETQRMLSPAQWSWLTALLDRPADVRLIVSSVQVIADGHSFECWRMIPRERNRLYALLKRRAQESRIILLSGDRLVGGFYEHDSTGLKEITSSSFTHSLPYGALPPCSEKDAMADDYDWEQCDEKDPRRIGGFVHENNFGLIEVDWEKRTVNVSLRMANTYPAHTHGSKKRVRGVKNAGSVLMERTYDIPKRGKVRK